MGARLPWLRRARLLDPAGRALGARASGPGEADDEYWNVETRVWGDVLAKVDRPAR